jgi:hypothetical protein
LLAPRGAAASAPSLSEAELTHEEVAELQGQLEQLGVAEAAKLAGDLVRLVPPTAGRTAPPKASAKDAHGVKAAPEAGQRHPELPEPRQKAKSASERFESFSRELKGG